MADQPVMSCEQVLLVYFQGNADMHSGRSSQVIFIFPITFEPLKMGGLCIKMVVIPKVFMLYFCSTP